MHVNLSSGGYDIVDSGQVFLFGEDKDLKIDIITDDHFQFSVVLKFYKNDLNEPKVEKEVVEQTIYLSCMNFDDMGTGLVAPFSVATLDGRELYLLFWSYLEGKAGEKVRSVKYTLFYER